MRRLLERFVWDCRRRLFGGFAALALAAAVTMLAPASSAASRPAVEIVDVVGVPAGPGECIYDLPPLSLAPDEESIERRVKARDTNNCVLTIEVVRDGSASADTEPGTGTSASAPAAKPWAASSGRAVSALAAATTSKGYYKVYWQDLVFIDVNWVQSELTWTWNGSTVTNPSGIGRFYWLSSTGWTRQSWNVSALTNTGSQAYFDSDAVYKNGPATGFCPISWVKTHYVNIKVIGEKNGTLRGTRTSTYREGYCGTGALWHADKLQRTQN